MGRHRQKDLEERLSLFESRGIDIEFNIREMYKRYIRITKISDLRNTSIREIKS